MVDWSERSRAGCRCVIQCVSTFDERGGSYQDNWLCKTKLLDAPIILRVKYNDYPKRATRLNAAILRRRAVIFFFFPSTILYSTLNYTYLLKQVNQDFTRSWNPSRQEVPTGSFIYRHIYNKFKKYKLLFRFRYKIWTLFFKPLWTKLRL